MQSLSEVKMGRGFPEFRLYYMYINNLADDFIQSDLQMKTMETIKINKRAMICKCYNKSVSLTWYT